MYFYRVGRFYFQLILSVSLLSAMPPFFFSLIFVEKTKKSGIIGRKLKFISIYGQTNRKRLDE